MTSTAKDKRIHTFGKGKKRTKLTDGELSVIVRASLQGIASADISAVLEEHTGRSLEPRTIRVVLAEQRAIWRDQVDRDTEMHFQLELERLDMMEAAAWEQYRLCGGYRKRKDIQREIIDPDGGMTTMTQEEHIDDPELALKWYREIAKLQVSRRKLLQLESTVNFTQQNLYAVKGYSSWTPDAWPDPPVKVISDGIVDGQYE